MKLNLTKTDEEGVCFSDINTVLTLLKNLYPHDNNRILKILSTSFFIIVHKVIRKECRAEMFQEMVKIADANFKIWDTLEETGGLDGACEKD
jgi:hypothetical protein